MDEVPPSTAESKVRSWYVDMLRFCASFCIVWYHNSYYFLLSGHDTYLVDAGKALLITWAMPFFYLMTVSLAWRSSAGSSWPKALRRLGAVIGKMIVFTILYEIPRFVFARVVTFDASYHPFSIDASSLAGFFSQVWTTILQVNDSPLYFLSHVAFLTIIVYVVRSMARRYNMIATLGGAGVVCIVMAYLGIPWLERCGVRGYFPGNTISFTATALALWYEAFFLSKKCVFTLKKHYGYALTLIALFGAGALYWLGTNYYIFPMVLVLLVRDRLVGEGARTAVLFARWGREYSFGIFAWHWFFLLIIAFFSKRFFSQPSSLAVYMMGTVLGFFLTWLGVVACRRIRFLRWFVTW